MGRGSTSSPFSAQNAPRYPQQVSRPFLVERARVARPDREALRVAHSIDLHGGIRCDRLAERQLRAVTPACDGAVAVEGAHLALSAGDRANAMRPRLGIFDDARPGRALPTLVLPQARATMPKSPARRRERFMEGSYAVAQARPKARRRCRAPLPLRYTPSAFRPAARARRSRRPSRARSGRSSPVDHLEVDHADLLPVDHDVVRVVADDDLVGCVDLSEEDGHRPEIDVRATRDGLAFSTVAASGSGTQSTYLQPSVNPNSNAVAVGHEHGGSAWSDSRRELADRRPSCRSRLRRACGSAPLCGRVRSRECPSRRLRGRARWRRPARRCSPS